jgi:RHS repeat-associated protein
MTLERGNPGAGVVRGHGRGVTGRVPSWSAVARSAVRLRAGYDRGVGIMRATFVSIVLVVAMIVPAVAAPGNQVGQVDGLGPPDVPGTTSLDPDSLGTIVPARPDARINLIEPPTAGAMGDATLDYPIELPPGRRGMEPGLRLAYDSGRSNGWLGQGWDLPLSTVTVDTRWGVPRYLSDRESETYLLDGEQLTPLAHRADVFAPRVPERIFHHRVEGDFRQIRRTGDQPSAFEWEVTDRSGTVWTYGGAPHPVCADAPTVLTDDTRENIGNIFLWPLSEVRDPDGNTVVYCYERVVVAGSEPGHQLYLASIHYTGYGDEPGPHVVAFHRGGGRGDPIVEARGGFKQVTDQLLREIEVSYAGETVRSYRLSYETGAFGRSLLTSVEQRGSTGSSFHTHTFAYDTEVRPGYGASETWNAHGGGTSPMLRGDAFSSVLGADVADTYGGNLYVGFNPWSPTKMFSGGVDAGYHYSTAKGIIQFVDINGNGLLDKVYLESGKVYARLNLGPTEVGFSEKGIEISGIGDISRSSNHTVAGGPAAFFGVNAHYNAAWNASTQSTYFLDVNGDGLVDLVDGGNVFFNSVVDGIPSFSPTSPVPFRSAAVDPTGLLPDLSEAREQQIDTFPLLDTVRRWTAPYDGVIDVAGTVSLLVQPDPDVTPDGVRVAIQHNGEELWHTSIAADDAAPKQPVVSGRTVRKGDRLYFRLQSSPDGRTDADGRQDQVAWDPTISYRADSFPVTAIDPNLYDPLHYQASQDHVLTGRRGAVFAAPIAGTLHIGGTLQKEPTTDDITVLVRKEGTTVFSETLAWDAAGSVSPSLDLQVQPGDRIHLRVVADSPIDLRRITWTPTAHYTAPADLLDHDGTPLVSVTLPYDADLYPAARGAQPAEPWIAPASGTVTVRADLRAGPGQRPAGRAAVLTVKRADGRLLKARTTFTFGPLYPLTGESRTITGQFDAIEGEEYVFDLSVYDPGLNAELRSTTITATWPTGEAWIVRELAASTDATAAEIHAALSDDPPATPAQVLTAHGVDVATFVADAVTRIAASLDALVGTGELDQPRATTIIERLAALLPTIIDAPVDDLLAGQAVVPHTVYTAYTSDRLGNGLFPQPHRGWASANYDGNRARASQPIHETRLRIDPDLATNTDGWATSHDEWEAGRGRMEVGEVTAYPLSPIPDDRGRWEGASAHAWVDAGHMSASRLGQDRIDVPTAEDVVPGGAGGTGRGIGVVRTGITTTDAIGGGFLALSVSGSTGRTVGEVDYLDLNGDGYPDIVSTTGGIRTTYPWGAHEQTSSWQSKLDEIRHSTLDATTIGIAGNPSAPSGSARGRAGATAGRAPAARGANSQKESLGIGGELGTRTSELRTDLIDLNGDGLPDRVRWTGNNLEVALNLGYRFAPFEVWGTAPIASEQTQDWGVNLGFNGGTYDYAGGVSFSHQNSTATRQLIDVNGDGLPDAVDLEVGTVAFNTGDGFALPEAWDLHDAVQTKGESLGLGGYATFPVGPLCLAACYLIINPGADGATSVSRMTADLRDVTGDGIPDLVTSDSATSLQVARNQLGTTNLLRRVDRPLGGTIELDYRREGNTTSMPTSKWVLARIEIDDGQPGDGPDRLVTEIRYADGYHDRVERSFYGFGRLSETQLDTEGNVYRRVVRTHSTSDYHTRGLLLSEVTQDGDGRPYVTSEYTYDLIDVATDEPLAPGTAMTAAAFPQLLRIDRSYSEGEPAAMMTGSVAFSYDRYGNVTRFTDLGEAGPEDDVVTLTDYHTDVADGAYIVDRPARVVVSGGGSELRRTEADYESGTGHLLTIRSYLADGEAATTDLAYDVYGNVASITGPPNHRGERLRLDHTYDEAVHTYVTRTADSFGHTSSTEFDPRFGVLARSTDLNGQVVVHRYDDFGRLTSVVGPYQAGTGRDTLRMEYYPHATVPWALTQQVDDLRDLDDPIETVQFVDGFGRLIQTKADAAVADGEGRVRDVMVVSGATVFDHVGRPVEQSDPLTEPLGTPGVYNAGVHANPPTVTSYDVLDRVTSTRAPDGSVTRITYGFGPDRAGVTRLLERITDPHGVPTEIHRDVRDRTVSVLESNEGGAQLVWTSYGYDPLGRITEVVDDHGNRTTASYDHLGRRTLLDSPDSGAVELVYDLASNLRERIPAGLREAGSAIRYDYRFTRLRTISYPEFPENDVTYTYGPPGATHNRAGRLATITDASGTEELTYGALGEIVRREKTIASATQGNSRNSPEVYRTDTSYDTWNRLRTLVYPDGERVTYEYDSGGSVSAVSGAKGAHAYPYVERRAYDVFGDVVLMEYGNGIRTTYDYNALTRCLESVTTGPSAAGGRPFQELRYSCDVVGNVTARANVAADPSSSEMGAATSFAYEYDDLQRLIGAEGSVGFAPNQHHTYRYDLSYDTIGNITSKTQTHTIDRGGNRPIPQRKTSYEWIYEYARDQPNAPSHIGDRSFSYDADGNQLGWQHDNNGTRRSITWDEEGRIRAIVDNGRRTSYVYNADGERVITRHPQGETAYVNPFFTIRNREVGTKHVHVDGTRVAAKLMRQDKPGANPRGQSPREREVYYFHGDHLGSTNYVTDADGELFQHTEYLPSGEILVEESSTTHRTPYRFTGQELDEETGLYAIGARSYDPRTSIWLSPDPMLTGFLPARGSADGLPGQGGVFNPRNLNLYAYGALNPVTFTDPRGTDPGRDGRVHKLVARYEAMTRAMTSEPARQAVAAARADQGSPTYPGVDAWQPTVLPAGTVLVAFAGSPRPGTGNIPGRRLGGVGAYYATLESLQDQGLMGDVGNPDHNEYAAGVQVGLGSFKMQRPWLAMFRLPADTPAAHSIVAANPQYGKGGLRQVFIPSWKESVPRQPFQMRYANPRLIEKFRTGNAGPHPSWVFRDIHTK